MDFPIEISYIMTYMSFFLELTNETEMMNIISYLKEGVSGTDKIVTRNVEYISDATAYPLVRFANLSFHKAYSP